MSKRDVGEGGEKKRMGKWEGGEGGAKWEGQEEGREERDLGLGFRVEGLGLRGLALGFRAWCSGLVGSGNIER